MKQNLIFQAESCFYECEPMLKHYEIKHSPGDLGDVPICGKYCDEWFEACKEDKTCTRDWLEGKLIHYRTYHWWIQGAGRSFREKKLELAPPGKSWIRHCIQHNFISQIDPTTTLVLHFCYCLLYSNKTNSSKLKEILRG